MSTSTAGPLILHWYDFVCPFCYIAQARNTALRTAGATLIGRPFEAHAETPPGGRYIGPRSGPMYTFLEDEARAAGLPLRWPPRLPNARHALRAAAWIETTKAAFAMSFEARVFAAHFARSEDIGDPACIDSCATEVGVDPRALTRAVADGSADALLLASEHDGRHHGVRGTPAWLINDELVAGLRSSDALLAKLGRA